MDCSMFLLVVKTSCPRRMIMTSWTSQRRQWWLKEILGFMGLPPFCWSAGSESYWPHSDSVIAEAEWAPCFEWGRWQEMTIEATVGFWGIRWQFWVFAGFCRDFQNQATKNLYQLANGRPPLVLLQLFLSSPAVRPQHEIPNYQWLKLAPPAHKMNPSFRCSVRPGAKWSRSQWHDLGTEMVQTCDSLYWILKSVKSIHLSIAVTNTRCLF